MSDNILALLSEIEDEIFPGRDNKVRDDYWWSKVVKHKEVVHHLPDDFTIRKFKNSKYHWKLQLSFNQIQRLHWNMSSFEINMKVQRSRYQSIIFPIYFILFHQLLLLFPSIYQEIYYFSSIFKWWETYTLENVDVPSSNITKSDQVPPSESYNVHY